MDLAKQTAADPGPQADQAEDLQELTIVDAIDIAKRAHQSGDFRTAAMLYHRVLETDPGQTEALHFAGLLQHQRGEEEEAVALLRQSIEADPGQAGWNNNLGNVLIELGRPEEAVAAFRAELARDPNDPVAHGNIGVALRLLNRPVDAEASYRRAIASDAKNQSAYDNLGRLLTSQGRIRDGIWAHAKARELDPHNERTRRHLVTAYGATGDIKEALAILDEWLADDPDNTIALHMRASMTGQDVPDRASDTYVQTLFDGFASSFDAQLARLGYRAPDLVVEAVKAVSGPPDGRLVVCDAGCGTGLCGPLLRPLAAEMVGVDLSQRMLDKAARRECYDALVKAELTQYLLEQPDRFDLIVSADTLCYFGGLGPVLTAAAGALKSDGILAFSVESATEVESFLLNTHGRYSHARAYVETTLESAGFTGLEIRRDVLRREVGEPVYGLVVVARRS